jgi:hypothetical protein
MNKFIEQGFKMNFKKFTMILAGLVMALSFNVNAGLVKLSFEFDTATHSVSRYDKATHTEYVGENATDVQSNGIISLSFNTVSQRTEQSSGEYTDAVSTQKDFSSYFFNNDNSIGIDSNWVPYFESFALDSPYFSGKDTTIQSTQTSIVYPEYGVERLYKSLHFTTTKYMNSGYSYFGDKANGNYTEILTQYLYSSSIYVDEVAREITEEPSFINEQEVLNKLLTKDITFSSVLSYAKIVTTYKNYEYTGQVLEDFTSEGYHGDAKLVQEVPEPSTLAIFALGIMGLAARRFKKQ